VSERHEDDELINFLKNSKYFMYRDSTLISAVRSPQLSARIILRDVIGKFAWNFEYFRAIGSDPMANEHSNDRQPFFHGMLKLFNEPKLMEELSHE